MQSRLSLYRIVIQMFRNLKFTNCSKNKEKYMVMFQVQLSIAKIGHVQETRWIKHRMYHTYSIHRHIFIKLSAMR